MDREGRTRCEGRSVRTCSTRSAPFAASSCSKFSYVSAPPSRCATIPTSPRQQAFFATRVKGRTSVSVARMSPWSNLSKLSVWRQTPVSCKRLAMAHWIGAAPLRAGKSEGWTLSAAATFVDADSV